MKTIHYILGVFALLFCACNNESMDSAAPAEKMVTVRISTNAAPEILPCTRTELNGLSVTWHTDDKVMFIGQDFIAEMANTLPAGSEATFEGQLPESAISNSNSSIGGYQFTLYPYKENAGNRVQRSSSENRPGFMNVVLPSQQELIPDTFGQGYNLSAATFQWQHSAVYFKNLCGLLRINLKGNVSVKSIEVTAPEYVNGTFEAYVDITVKENMCGTGTMYHTYLQDDPRGNPAKSKTVTLAAESPIALTDEPQAFYATVLPYTTTGEYTITAYTAEGQKIVKTVTLDKGVEAGEIRDMGEFELNGQPFDENEIICDAGGREVELNKVVKYAQGGYTAASAEEWITPTVTDNGLLIAVAPNTTGAERSGTVEVTQDGEVTKTIAVKQTTFEYEDFYGQYSLPYNGGYWILTLAEGEADKSYEATLVRASATEMKDYATTVEIRYNGIGASLLSLLLPQELNDYGTQKVVLAGVTADDELCDAEGIGYDLVYTGNGSIHGFEFVLNTSATHNCGDMAGLALTLDGTVKDNIKPVAERLSMTLIGHHEGNHDGFVKKEPKEDEE